MSINKHCYVKTYAGDQQEAIASFQQDAPALAAKGYFPISQNYIPGRYGIGAFVFALLLCFALVGILVFIYMLIVAPKGVLSVTYEFRGTAALNAGNEKTCPRCAEQVKAAATICRFCNHQF